MITIIDYGMGNLRSAQKGIEKGGYDAIITDDPSMLESADGIVLPGVGAFKDCYDGLDHGGFISPLLAAVDSGTPLLGICVGMQLLFDESEEGVGSAGLGLLKGKVVRFPDTAETGLKVPHMGWNNLSRTRGDACPILKDCSDNPYVYFVHSYHAMPTNTDDIYATATYGKTFPAVVGRNRIFGTQFHPEKSQAEGISILAGFGRFVQESNSMMTVN
jgi:glutamine amidotransferase